jgi:hypothetical protein
MKRWSQRLACFAAGLAVVFVVVVLAERLRGKWALNARLKTLALNGETLSLAKLKPRRPTSDQNAFTELLKLTNQLEVTVSIRDVAPPSLRLSSPGRAVVAAKLDAWSDDGKTTNDWQRLGLGLEQARETLARLESAVRKPAYDSGVDYEKGFVDFHLAPIWEVRQAYQLLSCSVLYALKQGNLGGAHDGLTALVTLTAKQTPEPLVICQLIRQACAALAFNTTWQALQADGWSDGQLASLQAAWQPCDFVTDMAFAMEMERAMTLDFYTQIEDSKKKLDFVIGSYQEVQEMTDGAFGTLPARGIIPSWLHLPVWRVAWLAQDELASLEQWQFMIERERLARTNGWAALTGVKDQPKPHRRLSFQSAEKLGWYDRLRFLFAFENNFSITDSVIRRTLEAQTQQQMALTVLGIQRYRLQTGRLPTQLSELVPECLTVLPHDFMDGKALRYRLRPGDDGFLLYSVGEDGKDDGGDPAWQGEKKNYRRIWDGRDAVWPSAATAQEAELAVGATKPDGSRRPAANPRP